MQIGEKKLSQIEEALYVREVKLIEEQLVKLGKDLAAIFEPYYNTTEKVGFKVSKECSESAGCALHEFVTQGLGMANITYYSGYSIRPQMPCQLPDIIKQAVLAKICADFIETVANVNEITAQLPD